LQKYFCDDIPRTFNIRDIYIILLTYYHAILQQLYNIARLLQYYMLCRVQYIIWTRNVYVYVCVCLFFRGMRFRRCHRWLFLTWRGVGMRHTRFVINCARQRVADWRERRYMTSTNLERGCGTILGSYRGSAKARGK